MKIVIAATAISLLAACGMAYAQTDNTAPVHDGANSTTTNPTTNNGDMSKGSVTKSAGYTGSTKHKKVKKPPAPAASASPSTPPVTNGDASGGSSY